MGRRIQDQAQLFYAFDLDAVVPDDHLVRKIAAVLDLSWVHDELAQHYSPVGRPNGASTAGGSWRHHARGPGVKWPDPDPFSHKSHCSPGHKSMRFGKGLAFLNSIAHPVPIRLFGRSVASW
jgi:hypothetical protein